MTNKRNRLEVKAKRRAFSGHSRRNLLRSQLGRCVVALVVLGIPLEIGYCQEPVDPTSKEFHFENDIAPILKRHCLHCHGPEKSLSSFRVDEPKSLREGGDYGEPTIVAGQVQESFLVQVIDGTSDELTMPPDGESPLSAEEIATIKSWIEQGAKMNESPGGEPVSETHWSLRPLRSPVVPESAQYSSPIDRFIVSRLNLDNLQLSPRAERRVLIRRLYLVMLGLLPTPTEVDAFLADDSVQAWENLVDRVLASPHYGERWGRHWLDIVRFGETDGFETNRERPNAWRYRDWVIASFNEDKPYDRFVKAQIAGDVLRDPIGTSFLVGGPVDIVKSPDIQLTKNQRQDELTDFVNTSGTSFLGLTIGCARCHNHKFDPISQRDFYALEAVFSGVEHGEQPLPPTPEMEAERNELDRKIDDLTRALSRYQPDSTGQGSEHLPAVNAARNVDRFAPVSTHKIRFVSLRTNNHSEPCLDELQIFAGDTQIGLADSATKVTSSGSYEGNPKHQLKHINDNRFGNDFSWISNEVDRGWVELELTEPVVIDRVEWGRDREGTFSDRLPVEYRIEVTTDGTEWRTVSDSNRRLPYSNEDWESSLNLPDPATEAGREARESIAQLRTLREQRSSVTNGSAAYVGIFRREPAEIRRLFRGDAMNELEPIPPGTIETLGDLNLAPTATDPERRLAFAEWVVSATNPLTPRVIVNRIWQYQFGTGLVDTPSDFGRNGTTPSHPELLDWLAVDFMDGDGRVNAWSIKRLQRQILLSETWQQHSLPNADGLERDAATRLLWRFPPRRLEAEAIRDNVCRASHVLDLTIGGPGFSAFEVELENVRHYFPRKSFGESDWRRMVYQTKVRQEQDSIFGAFDCPDASQVAPRRSQSTTPLQALNLFNSQFMLQQAQLFAQHLRTLSESDIQHQIDQAFQICYSRKPSPEELKFSRDFVNAEGLAAFCRAILNSNEFLFIQ